MGRTVAELVAPERPLTEVAEGEEPDAFWDALGGKGDYAPAREDLDRPLLCPRLFHCIITPLGYLRVNEVSNFTQEVNHLCCYARITFCAILS